MKRFKVDIMKYVISPKVLAIALVIANMSQITGSQAQSVQIDGNDNININEDIRKFCDNITDVAKDKRYLLQREELHKLQIQVDERIEALKIQRDDYKQWLKKRNDFLEKAEVGLVEIFKKMKPDAAAKQLEIIDQNIAAALLMKLSPRLSSQIFNEMNAKKAARLATIIASTVNQDMDETQS